MDTHLQIIAETIGIDAFHVDLENDDGLPKTEEKFKLAKKLNNMKISFLVESLFFAFI